MTSDVGAALFFLAAVGAWQRMLNRTTAARISTSVLAAAGLFGVKMSAPLIVPIAGLLTFAKLVESRPWRWSWGRRHSAVRGVGPQLLLAAALLVVHAVVVAAVLWASYGFRYSAFAEHVAGRDDFTKPWPMVLEGCGWKGDVIRFARDNRLLPEAYLYGLAHTLKHAMKRPAFLNGRYSETGWAYYFPLVFGMKTPLPTLLLLFVALGVGLRKTAAAGRRARIGLRRALPLICLIAIYWGTAITSNLNIGFRHLLPALPPAFILLGVVGRCQARVQWVLTPLLLWLAIEAGRIHPHYLAYFNQLVGGPSQGYRHLVDSNLDWGQDILGLKRWLASHGLGSGKGPPVYVSCFGTCDPKYYSVDYPTPLEPQSGIAGIDERTDLGGVYCLSATILIAPMRGKPPWGPVEERLYWELQRQAKEQRTNELADQLLTAYQLRLKSYLLSREPDDQIGYSILIYRLSNEEVRRALFGPPPKG
jgi:hypothetical protein